MLGAEAKFNLGALRVYVSADGAPLSPEVRAEIIMSQVGTEINREHLRQLLVHHIQLVHDELRR